MGVEEILVGFIFVGRLGDVLSTSFVSPTMKLEANPLARRFKRVTTALGFLLCLVPYYNTGLAVMVAVPSLLVAAANLQRGWLARALGEAEMEAVLVAATRKGSLASALWMGWIGAGFLLLAAGLLFLLSDGWKSWGYWFAMGIAVYAAAEVHRSLYFIRLFRKAEQARPVKAV